MRIRNISLYMEDNKANDNRVFFGEGIAGELFNNKIDGNFRL